MSRRWPNHLWIVRYRLSSGNAQRDQADAAGLEFIDVAERDINVLLSDLGVQQSLSQSGGFAAMPESRRPDIVLASPYVRAAETARCSHDVGGVQKGTAQHVDERRREREFGVLDRLTRAGIVQRDPGHTEARTRLGKFYYRPPGGES